MITSWAIFLVGLLKLDFVTWFSSQFGLIGSFEDSQTDWLGLEMTSIRIYQFDWKWGKFEWYEENYKLFLFYQKFLYNMTKWKNNFQPNFVKIIQNLFHQEYIFLFLISMNKCGFQSQIITKEIYFWSSQKRMAQLIASQDNTVSFDILSTVFYFLILHFWYLSTGKTVLYLLQYVCSDHILNI